jgi:hypothetical protein
VLATPGPAERPDALGVSAHRGYHGARRPRAPVTDCAPGCACWRGTKHGGRTSDCRRPVRYETSVSTTWPGPFMRDCTSANPTPSSQDHRRAHRGNSLLPRLAATVELLMGGPHGAQGMSVFERGDGTARGEPLMPDQAKRQPADLSPGRRGGLSAVRSFWAHGRRLQTIRLRHEQGPWGLPRPGPHGSTAGAWLRARRRTRSTSRMPRPLGGMAR